MSEKQKLDNLNQATQHLWNQKAEFWDNMMGEGNLFHRELVGPTAEKLLAIQSGEVVLDVACGNGQFARRLAELGAQVIATDFSAVLLERAQAYRTQYSHQIEYQLVDATDETQIIALGERRFDAVVCNMALMDIASIEPLFNGLSKVLKLGGRFVFTIMHPCFNSTDSILGIEEKDREGSLVETYYVKTSNYLNLTPSKGGGAPGEPNPHYYFHRPLHVVFNTAFQAGFVLDCLEEPAFSPAAHSQRPLSWANFKTVPPVLAARLRLF